MRAWFERAPLPKKMIFGGGFPFPLACAGCV